MNQGTKIVLWILVAIAIVGVWLMAFNSGYTFGSDMAKRDNAAEER